MDSQWKPAFDGLKKVSYVLTQIEELRDKHIKILEATQEDEKEYFWRDLAKSNLLVFLYSFGTVANSRKLREQNERTLARDNKNITALTLKERICKRDRSSESKKVSDELKELETDKDEFVVQNIIRSSEIAFVYSYVHPSLYLEAIERYEKVIDWYEREASANPVVKERLQDRLCGWYFHLAQTYSRMMNKGRSHLLLREKSTAEVFEEICRRLLYIIDEKDEYYSGKAMIELVDAFKKCETSPEGDRVEFPIKDRNVDDYMLEAMNMSPSDPYVLERCGRHYRQRGHDEETFFQAEQVLRKTVDLYPKRHVAWHHLGLVYRSLWLETGNYTEAKMHRNGARRGKNNKRRYQRNMPRGNGNHSVNRASTNTEQHVRNLSARSNVSHLESPDNSGEDLAFEFKKSFSLEENPVMKAPSNLTGLPQTAPPSLPTLRPKFPTQRGQAPRQGKKPDFYDECRVRNPSMKSENCRSSQFLRKAESCFEEACKWSNNTSCRYFIDLCRVLISLGDVEKAEQTFITANDLIERARTVDDNDCAYFYEQWALFRSDKLHDQDSVKNVMMLYRNAIYAAMMAKIRSKMSFYNLRDKLKELTNQEPQNEAVRLEYKVLYETIEKYADEEDALVKCLKNGEDTRSTVLWLIKFLYGRDDVNDASVAFFYITALKKAGHFDLHGSDESKENRDMIVTLVTRINKEGRHNTAAFQAFLWLAGDETMEERGFEAEPGHTLELGPFDACVLAPSGDSRCVEDLLYILEKELRLRRVCRGFVSDNDDTRPGSYVCDGLCGLVSQSKFVFIVEDYSDVKQWNVLVAVLYAIFGIPNSKACLVTQCTSPECGKQLTKPHSERWPRFVISGKKDSMVYELLKTMSDARLHLDGTVPHDGGENR